MDTSNSIFPSFIKVIFQSLLVPVTWQPLALNELIVLIVLELYVALSSSFSNKDNQRCHKAQLFIKVKFLDLSLYSLPNDKRVPQPETAVGPILALSSFYNLELFRSLDKWIMCQKMLDAVSNFQRGPLNALDF